MILTMFWDMKCPITIDFLENSSNSFTDPRIYIYIYICDPEEPFKWSRGGLAPGHVEIIFIILALFRVLSTLSCFSLGNSVSVFFFWLEIRATWLFSSTTCIFRLFFFYRIFFPGYQFVEFANCTICFFFTQTEL